MLLSNQVKIVIPFVEVEGKAPFLSCCPSTISTLDLRLQAAVGWGQVLGAKGITRDPTGQEAARSGV